MQKLMLIVLGLAGLFLVAPVLATDSNQIATNQVPSGIANTNAIQRPSDAELQAAAQHV